MGWIQALNFLFNYAEAKPLDIFLVLQEEREAMQVLSREISPKNMAKILKDSIVVAA